eukprot:1844145-Amphidinium_carterae.1
MMGGMQPTAATATASNKEETPGAVPTDTGRAEGSTDRKKPMAERPEDLPEEGEQDIEDAHLRPEKRGLLPENVGDDSDGSG